jgi:aminopeptidase N
MQPPGQIVLPSSHQGALDPAARIEELADSDAEAFAFFLERFGPPPTKQVIVSPIPAGFGQGFPGLVYAATLSYLRPTDAPLQKLEPADRQFYLELLRPHEIAHQWWGNNVTIESGADLWLMEALATYSSLLYVEGKQGPQALRSTLAGFLGHLMLKNDDGEVIESAGPVSLGERLNMAKFPAAYRLVLYEKGAWIFHMLRGAMGDKAFFALLTDLSKTYRLAELSTEQLREAAAQRLPKDYPDGDLRDFFDQWVYGTGIPRLQVDFQRRETGGKAHIEGVLKQTGVPEHFTMPVTLRVELENAKPLDVVVWTEGPETSFRIESGARPARVLIDPDGIVLAIKN